MLIALFYAMLQLALILAMFRLIEVHWPDSRIGETLAFLH